MWQTSPIKIFHREPREARCSNPSFFRIYHLCIPFLYPPKIPHQSPVNPPNILKTVTFCNLLSPGGRSLSPSSHPLSDCTACALVMKMGGRFSRPLLLFSKCHLIRCFDQVLEILQELCRRSAVHQPVVENKRQHHHLAHNYLAIYNNCLRRDPAHP